MQDGVEAPGEGLRDRRGVAEVGLDERHGELLGEGSVPALEVVEDRDVVARPRERPDRVRSDVAGAARREDLQGFSPGRILAVE